MLVLITNMMLMNNKINLDCFIITLLKDEICVYGYIYIYIYI